MANTEANQSIHPRVVNGRTAFPKVNTAMPRRNGLSPSKLANMKAHYERHPNDGATASRLSKNGK